MPDIAMCLSNTCKKRKTCYRHIATPNKYGQSYGYFIEKDCDSYIECKSKGQLRRLNIQCEGEQE